MELNVSALAAELNTLVIFWLSVPKCPTPDENCSLVFFQRQAAAHKDVIIVSPFLLTVAMYNYHHLLFNHYGV